MSLIDSSYFVGEISLPNVDKRQNNINRFIEIYEEEILIDLLGYDLYSEFIQDINGGSPSQKFLDLRDGKEFTFTFEGREVSTKWEGLINSKKKSLIAYYVYFKIRQNEVTLTSSTGEVKPKHQNSVRTQEVRKMLNAWRKFLNLYGFVEYSNQGFKYSRQFQNALYFDKYSETYDTFNDAPSAFNFLNEFRDQYQNWIFSPHEDINYFGL